MRHLLAFGTLAVFSLGISGTAQQTNPGKAPTSEGQSNSKVIFSRSEDSEAQQQAKPEDRKAPGIAVTDAERKAVTFTSYELDVRLHPAEEDLAVRAVLTVRNDGIAPVAHLPLQISSGLKWETVRLQGRPIAFQVADLKSDADHTGLLHEIGIPLPEPLAPGKELQLDVIYSGKIPPSHQRLEPAQMPDDVAAQSDWDRVSTGFVGLRGFGNVVWYPVSSVPAFLGDGAKLFDSIGEQKLRQTTAHFQAKVSVEYLGDPPNVAVVNGKLVPISVPLQAATPDIPQIATFQIEDAPLGFGVPTLFVATREEHATPLVHIYSRPENAANTQAYATAATMVAPLVKEWLGPSPQSPVTIIDLPEAKDAAAEFGSVLLIPVAQTAPEQLTQGVAHLLAHATFQSPREWLNEGVARFVDILWLEQQKGRDDALAALQSSRRALALEEPATPQDSPGQPLLAAGSSVYYREKASSVLWMLRDLTSDAALSSALRGYRAAEDKQPEYFEKLLEASAKGKDLRWFFDDWVYRDRGLPDLSISAIYTNPASVPDSTLVAIDLTNDGWASTNVPVTVRSDKTSVTERVFIPAHEKLVYRVVVQGKPAEVQINDGTVPEVQASIHIRPIN